MAKPTQYAPIICVGVSVIAVVGIIVSLILSSALPAILLLFPAIFYEIYRTEGASTKTASIIICIVLFLELIILVTHFDIDLGGLLGQNTKYIGGYEVPLGLLSVVGPTVIAILAIILFVKTYGIYTRALAVVIFISSLIIIYTLNPPMLKELFKFALQEALDRISYL